MFASTLSRVGISEPGEVMERRSTVADGDDTRLVVAGGLSWDGEITGSCQMQVDVESGC